MSACGDAPRPHLVILARSQPKSGDRVMPTNNHAIVIGVGPGLGAALVEKCAREGMKVTAGARDRDRLRKLLDERGLKAVPASRCDVTDESSVAGAFKDAIAAHGAPD